MEASSSATAAVLEAGAAGATEDDAAAARASRHALLWRLCRPLLGRVALLLEREARFAPTGEYAGGEQANVRITNCVGEIRNILRIANFQRLFQID